jgi:molybdopterin converting factor small subunit
LAKVKVRLFFDLIPESGRGEVELEADDFEGLLSSLTGSFGERFLRPLYDAEGRPRPYALVYHNGRALSLSSASELRFKDGDVVLLLPPVGGG